MVTPHCIILWELNNNYMTSVIMAFKEATAWGKATLTWEHLEWTNFYYIFYHLQKISRRCSAVDTLDWEEKKKERCKKFLVAEYTSSDESEVSEDENGCNVKRFVVKRLSWESERLRELKDFLDFTYKKSLPPHVRHFQTERVVGERSSSKRPPANAPKWTLKNESPKPLATSTPLRERRLWATYCFSQS